MCTCQVVYISKQVKNKKERSFTFAIGPVKICRVYMVKWASRDTTCRKITFLDSSNTSNIFPTLFNSTVPDTPSQNLGPIIPKDIHKICLILVFKSEKLTPLWHTTDQDFLSPSELFTRSISVTIWFPPKLSHISSYFTFLLRKFRALSMKWLMCCGLKEEYAPSRSFWMEEILWEGFLVCYST